MGWADAASSVHVKDSCATTAWRPGQDTRVGLKVKVATIFARKAQSIVNTFWITGEGESVGAFSFGTSWDLGVTNHVGVKDGEPNGR